jgi:hypothetical protein
VASSWPERKPCAKSGIYFRRPDFLAGFLAFTLADFLLPVLAAFVTVRLVAEDLPLPLPKMFSQLSEYCLVAPTRVTVITLRCSCHYEVEIGCLSVAKMTGSRSGLAAGAKASTVL